MLPTIKWYWSRFTAGGYQLKEMNLDESKWTEISEMEIKDAAVEFPVAHSNELHDIFCCNRFPTENLV